MTTWRAAIPARQVCPLCALDDSLTWEIAAPGVWRFTCTSCKPEYSWLTTTLSRVDERDGSGIAHELGVYDALLSIFTSPGPFLEWGIVEHHFASENRAAYDELVGRYSHTCLGPTRYSVSAFLGLAAGQLAREGDLAIRWVDATGYWAYNGTISAFTIAPAPDDAPTISWAEFADDHGFDPGDWPALGFRKGSRGASGRLISMEPWRAPLGAKWFREEQVSSRGLCAWNHTLDDVEPATHHVVVEDAWGHHLHYAVCDACIPSVHRYTGTRPSA